MQEEQGGQSNPTQSPDTGWTFHADNTQPAAAQSAESATPQNSGSVSVNWTASEFIAHQKSAGWYVALIGGAIGLSALVMLLTDDVISAIVVLIAAAVFGVFASRKPRELQYQLDNNGLRIAEKFYPYGNFKSFALMKENGVGSVWFMPLKRFMPILTVYYAPQDEQKIADVISQHLPLENKQPDAVDKLLQKVRF